MEETTNVEMMADDLGFDAADFADEMETGNQTGETETKEVQQAEESGSESTEIDTDPSEGAAEASGATESQAETKPELFDLKFLGETKQYTREEMTTLAQKGLNYDRVLQQREELQQFRSQNEGILTELDAVAKQFGMDVPAMLNAMQKNLLRQQGKTDAEAEAIIRADKADRQLQTYQTQEQRVRQQQEEAQQRQQRDVEEFVRRYPNMDYKTIPASVWQDVRKGDTLVNAYGRYEAEQLRAENQRLQQQIAAKQQNDKNKQNSLGSMQSGAATPKTDPFLEGFDQG